MGASSNTEKWLQWTKRQREIEQQLETALADCKLALNEYYVLYYLEKAASQSMRLSELQQFVGLSQSAMSRMIARLEAKACGVIERRVCETDKRGIYVYLTAKGLAKLKKGEQVVEAVLQAAL